MCALLLFVVVAAAVAGWFWFCLLGAWAEESLRRRERKEAREARKRWAANDYQPINHRSYE